MLKRKDLVSQFEVVVKQEIKKYNDSLLHINVSINNFEKKISDIEARNNRRFAELERNIQHLEILISENNKKFASFDGDIKNLSFTDKEIAESVKREKSELLFEINSLKSDFIELKASLSILNGEVEKSKKTERLLSEIIYHKEKEFKKLLDKNAEEATKKIQEKSDELNPVKEAIYSKIDEYEILIKGYLREIDVMKKKRFVLEKNIENIYTQIERLSKKFE